MNPIVAATDFSEAASWATQAAAQLARRFDSELVLAHAMESPGMLYPELAAAQAQSWETAIGDQLSAKLDEAATPLRAWGVTVATTVLRGSPADALCDEARRRDARLIVLGTHGRGALGRFFIGSVAERTLVAADRPVLVVRQESAGLGAWAGGERPLRVAVGVDDSEPARNALRFVAAFRKAGPCDTTLVHVCPPPTLPAKAGPDADKKAIDAIAAKLAPLAALLEGAGTVTIKVAPNWGNPGDALVDRADDLDADLIVLGTHQRTLAKRLWLGSVAQSALRATHKPVLVVPSSHA